ncbi:hypothetical protein SME06J_49030 (plasmid) [Serratia marcescens]|nr:hypothetical protein SME06J_49030 [Serratia marcescens]
MKTDDKKTNQSLYANTWASVPALLGIALSLPALAADNAQIQIKATVTAVCTLSAPPLIDLGAIPITAFDGKNAGEELKDYGNTFTITTACSGTDKYKLTFTPSAVNNNCLTASSDNLGFCFYGPDGTKIDLAGNRSLQDNTGTAGTEISVFPMRRGTPTAGEHTGTMTVTIEPI